MPVSYALLKKFKSEEEKDSFISYYNNSKSMTDVIKGYLEEKLSEKESIKEEDFESPSFAYKHAYRAGYAEAIRDVIKLLP